MISIHWTVVSLLLAAAAPPAAASVTAEEAAVAERLSRQGEELLASILGPGRGKVVVAVSGEQVESDRHYETTELPAKRLEFGAEPKFDWMLPGYAQEEKPAETKVEETPPSRTQENSRLQTGLRIQSLRVSVVLDARATQAQAAAVAQIMPKLLGVDPARGDEFVVMRAELRPAWESAALQYVSGPEAIRAAVRASTALLLLILGGLLLRGIATGTARALVREMAALRAPVAEEKPEEERPAELLAGGPPSLALGAEPSAPEPPLPAEGGEAPPALGHRFDFLAAQGPSRLAKLIGGEPPAELALLFASLSASHPDLSAALFAELAPAARAEVSRALAGLTETDPERLAALEARLRGLVDFGVRGAERLGAILSRLPAEQREPLLEDAASAHPDVAEELRRALFSFEDVASLRDADFRRLISAVPYADWGVALRGADEALAARVEGELEPGPRGLVREAMERPHPRADVVSARSKVVTAALDLAARGQIARPTQSEELI